MNKEKFYVSHYVNEPVLENSPLKRIVFFTTLDKEITNKTEFYREFDAGKTFTKKDLESGLKDKKIIELPQPLYEIKKNEGIWKDKDKNIYLTDAWKPFGNYKKIKIN